MLIKKKNIHSTSCNEVRPFPGVLPLIRRFVLELIPFIRRGWVVANTQVELWRRTSVIVEHLVDSLLPSQHRYISCKLSMSIQRRSHSSIASLYACNYIYAPYSTRRTWPTLSHTTGAFEITQRGSGGKFYTYSCNSILTLL